MINFVKNGYETVINAFIEPIIKELNKNEYMISEEAKNDMVNVIFFTEDTVYKKINADKINGINVFYTHGMADKNWRTANRVDKFDYVFAHGDLWVEKLISEGMNPDKILLNGYTRLDNIYNKKDIYVKKCKDKKTILFAPTHTACGSTYGKYDDIIKILVNDYNVLISPHPSNKQSKKITGEEFLEADVICGDYGSSIYESWTLNKPCVFGDWIIKDRVCSIFIGSFEDYIYKNQIGRHASNPNEFIKMIELACLNGITQKEVDFIDGIFNKELRGKGGKLTADYLREIVKDL